ncbi:MAG: hypothetical protein KTR20_12385 [Cellvibrionaceae bacterium]|nr:hypothetical protein [Cellvibrionaceae bacterium]
MTKDSSWAWQEMMANWQASQQSMTETMLENFQLWNNTIKQPPDNHNPMMALYQKFFQSLSPSPPSPADNNNAWSAYFKGMPDADALANTMQTLINNGQALFESLTTDHLANSDTGDLNAYFLKALLDISSPKTWLHYTGDTIDLGINKLSEGPFFSGITDMDQRLAQASDSWMELFKQSKDYHAIVFDRWTQAYSHYIDELTALQKAGNRALPPKQLIELWASIANKELLNLHRSEEYLDAQSAVIRASLQYRLHEKNIAAVVCEALHIPTRDEVDELHKTVTELRRTLRQTQAQLKKLSDSTPAKRKSRSTKARQKPEE